MAMILGNYIDGRWIAPRAGATFTKHNPADARDVIGEFPASNATEVQDAVSAAQRALPAWRALSYDARAQFLYKASAAIAARQSDIAAALTREEGKAMRFAREVEAGLVRINGETAGVEPQAPFGGMKNSSSFSREQGQAARDFYTQVKTISMDRAD